MLIRVVLQFICFFLLLISFTGCVNKETPKRREHKESVSDLLQISQNLSSYLKDIKSRYIGTLKEYEKFYFKPWNIDKIDISLKEAMWAYNVFDSNNSYGENLQQLDSAFFKDALSRSNFKDFATLNRYAITVKLTNIRAFPTQKPLFMNPKKAGEGFPFDYLQNSVIAPNKPLFVSHYSRDREWVFVKASFAYGWVKRSSIAFLPKKYVELYQNAKKEFVIKEGVALYDNKNNFLFRSRIGMMLPEIQEFSDQYTVLAISRYKNNQAFYRESKVSKKVLHSGILKFDSHNIKMIFNEVVNTKYGWGGIYGDRDCSSILRDFYAPFGVWLPRNSYGQSRVGKVFSLKNLSDEEKIAKIKTEAVPFETLLYKKGHILMYVGIRDGKIIVFHNTWGIKTEKNGVEGRFILGKPLFSSLKIGSNLEDYDEKSSILHNLQSMNIVTLPNEVQH